MEFPTIANLFLYNFRLIFSFFCTLVLCWNGDFVEIENAADNDDIYDGDCERCDFDDDDDVASMHHWCPPIYLQVSAPSAVFVCCLGINHLPKPLTLTTSLGSPSFCLCIFIFLCVFEVVFSDRYLYRSDRFWLSLSCQFCGAPLSRRLSWEVEALWKIQSCTIALPQRPPRFPWELCTEPLIAEGGATKLD